MNKGTSYHYKRWRTQKGKPTEVEALEFLSYYRQGNNLVVFKVNNKRYIGEKWLCLVNGKKKKLMFRVEYFGRTEKVKKQKPIADYVPNPITDSRDACEQRDWRKDENETIEYLETKDKKTYKILKKIAQKYPNECVKDGARLKLEFLDKAFNSDLSVTPVYPTSLWMRYQIWRTLNPECAIFLNYIINMNL